MKKLIIMGLVWGLVACGGASPNAAPPPNGNNHGYGFEYEQISSKGLKLRYIDEPLSEFRLTAEDFQKIFDEVSDCLKMASEPPFVIIDFGPILCSNGALTVGCTEYIPPLVILMVTNFGRIYSPILKHEFIHIIKWNNGEVFNVDYDHDDEAFSRCV